MLITAAAPAVSPIKWRRPTVDSRRLESFMVNLLKRPASTMGPYHTALPDRWKSGDIVTPVAPAILPPAIARAADYPRGHVI
jgi:hypothetical protein